MAERTFTASAAGPIHFNLDLAAGAIHIDSGPHVTTAHVTIKTNADTGPSAEAIRTAAIEQNNRNLSIRIKVPAGAAMGGGIFVQSAGSVCITGDRVFVNGVEVSSGAASGGSSPIEVWAYLPVGSAAEVATKTASTYTSGHLDRLSYQASSGSLYAASVGELDASTSSGGIDVTEVTGEMSVMASSGSIRVEEYSGAGPSTVSASSGSITVRATARSRGRLNASASSGSIRLLGTAHLDVRHRVSSGSVRIS